MCMRKILHMVKRAVKREKSAVRRVHVVVDAPVDKRFVVVDGSVCGNIKELRTALLAMSDEHYHFHTVPRGNDFAAWVRDVLGQGRLAERLEAATTREDAIRVLQ
jgi:hypothetical protein